MDGYQGLDEAPKEDLSLLDVALTQIVQRLAKFKGIKSAPYHPRGYFTLE